MKKITVMVTGAILIIACVFSLGDNTASAFKGAVGTYQCAICGLISKITSNSSVLSDRDLLGDGHTHDWRYIGGLSGTIHPIR